MSAPRKTSERLRTMEELSEALHAMCQPLTALQCQLELGQMNEDAAVKAAMLNGQSVMRAERMFEECTRECIRLNAIVGAMRVMIQKGTVEEQGRNG